MLSTIALWIDERLHVSTLFASTAGHTVPASAGSWFYVFGSGTLLCFIIQIVTGICLAFVYVPAANSSELCSTARPPLTSCVTVTRPSRGPCQG